MIRKDIINFLRKWRHGAVLNVKALTFSGFRGIEPLQYKKKRSFAVFVIAKFESKSGIEYKHMYQLSSTPGSFTVYKPTSIKTPYF